MTFVRAFLAAAATVAIAGCSAPEAEHSESAELASETLFGATTPASGDAVDSDSAAVELGVRFQSQVAGQIRGVRFYRGAANAAGYTVHLWTSAGAVLATATGSHAALGWQEISFATPIAIAANTTYVASYLTSNGRYAGTNGGFATARTSGHLAAPAGAGVYRYGGGFPTSAFQSTNYWVDVQFDAASTDTALPNVAVAAPAAGATVAGNVVVTGTASDDQALASVAVQIDGGAFAAATGTTSWQYAWNTTSVVDGGHTVAVRATDAAGNVRTASVAVVVANGGPAGCDRTANSAATLATAWAAATAGQTICLATGNYGAFTAGSKTGLVTVRPQTGATATLEVSFNGARNVRLDGLTIAGGAILNTTRDITIANCTFTAGLQIVNVANANILLDHNTHLNINAPTGSTPARVHLAYSSATASGVTIQNSLFAGGDADGIQTGVGVNIIGNAFRDIVENGPNHTDSIQLIGATGAVVRGNYIHNCASGIVAYDGVDHATIEDNVVDLGARPWAIELYSDNGSIIRHNTLPYGACDYNLPCGIINLSRKTADPAGTGTIVRDNVASEIDAENGSTVAARDHNLLRFGASSGELAGAPVYAGGASPTSYAGFRLATSSPGRAAASDGSDIGIP